MKPDRDDYQALLESLADGAPVDWAALDASASTSAERRRYRNLRLVARVAELHRTIVPNEDEAAPSLEQSDLADPDPAAWGHLSIVAPLASGAFGRIYRARDAQLNRDVALKLLRGDIALFRPIERLLGEARTLAKVRHPNVVTVHGADVRDGRAGLWMELVDGQTLEGWLSAHGVMGPGEATGVGIDLCRALAAVHSAGLVHGDVKAQNVMREQGGRIVLMDFGAGRAQGADVAGLAGTPMYLAPEVLAGEPPTPQSDLYSLGVLLFHLLTGKYPYSGLDLEGLRSAHADSARVWLRDVRPDLPQQLVQTIERAIDPDPARRFPSAGAMEAALGGTTPVRPQIHPGLLMTAAALVCLVVGLIAWSRIVQLHRGAVLSGIRSVGVLPMKDLTGAKLPPEFAAGLTDDLISRLGEIRSLTIKPAALRAGADHSPAGIARTLDVDALLETTLAAGEQDIGSGRVRVRARLIAAGTQGMIWSQEFNSRRGEALQLAGAIADAVAHVVNVTMTPTDSARLTQARSTNPGAEEAYLIGRTHLDQYGPGNAALALTAFQRALQLDSLHAASHASLARAYVSLGLNGAIPETQARGAALDEVRRALELDPDLAEAHATLAHIRFIYDWDWPGAESEFQRSLELNGSSPYARGYYAEYLAASRRFDEAVSQADTARRLDPESGGAARRHALVLYYRHDFAGAARVLAEASGIEPNNAGLPLLEGRIAEAQGRLEAALEATRLALRLSGGTGVPLRVQEIRQQALLGRRAEALSGLLSLERESKEGRIRLTARDLAYIQLAFGDTRQALELFGRAVDDRDPTVTWLGVDPRLDSLQRNERFRQLLRTIRVPLGS